MEESLIYSNVACELLEIFKYFDKELKEKIPEKLKETNYIYKVGLDYGIIEEHPWNGLFYFEWLENNCKE